MLGPLNNLLLNHQAIQLCAKSKSLSSISHDVQERLIGLLSSQRRPEELWNAVSNLHLLAVKERRGELASRLAECAKPYLGVLPSNLNLLIADKAERCFNSLALAQIPFFSNLFNGSYDVKWKGDSLFVNDELIKISSLDCLVKRIQSEGYDFSDFGMIKLRWFMQQMDHLYGGFHGAPEPMRDSVLARLMSIATPSNIEQLVVMSENYQLDTVAILAAAIRTGEDLDKCSHVLENAPKRNEIMEGIKACLLAQMTISHTTSPSQLLNYYSIASYFGLENLMSEALATLTADVHTPMDLRALWSTIDSPVYHHLNDDCALFQKLSAQIQLRPGKYDCDMADWAYVRALRYEQSQWGRVLVSNLVDLNDEFVFGYLEGSISNNLRVLTRDLEYATTQYLLGRVGTWLNIVGNHKDFDRSVPKKSRKTTALQKEAIINLQRFSKVADRVTEMDGPFLAGVTQKNLAWLFSKLNPERLKTANLDDSQIDDATILHPFKNLVSLSIKNCLSLRKLNLTDTMTLLENLDLSNCMNLDWKIGWVCPKPRLTRLSLENVSIGDPDQFRKFPRLRVVSYR
ncbi:MAG: hypothetical protein Q8K75_02055 [Chlamydiales bacterium]|nr:hypothetical protein [Chlamydiales bacterium]